MVNPAVSTIAKGTSRVGGGLFSKLLRIKWGYLIVVVVFIQAIAIGINGGGGLIGVLETLGERLFNVLQNIQVASLDIIEKEATFDGLWDVFDTGWALLSNVYLMYFWLKLISSLWGKSPFSNESQYFINVTLGVLIFLILQIFYLFLFSAPLEGQTNFDLFRTPLNAFVDLFKALVLLFSSFNVERSVDNVLNYGLDSCNESVCVI